MTGNIYDSGGVPAKVTLGVLLSVFFAVPYARGSSVLFDNGDPGFGNAFVSDPQFPIQYSDDFALGEAATVGGLSWFGAYKLPGPGSSGVIGPDNFSIRVFGMNGTTPDVNPIVSFSGLSVSRTDTGQSLGFPGEKVFAYGVSVPSTALGPGTYLLSIVNQTIPGDDWWMWAWSNQSFQAGKALYLRAENGDSWNGPFTTQVSFKLLADAGGPGPIDDTVTPEPAGFSLAAAGLLGLACMARVFSARRE
jgi:hypothetical protein